MSEVNFRAEYSGYIGDEKIAWLYKAYAEEGQPYVVVLNTGDGDALSIVQDPEPGLLDEDLDARELDDRGRRNAIRWVETLTELMEKARVYDEIFDDVKEADRAALITSWPMFHDLHAGEEDLDDDDVCAICDRYDPDADDDCNVVESLGHAEIDSAWVDCEGDHYKFIDGEWYLSGCGAGKWEPTSRFTAFDALTEFGPYRVVTR
jgi:hypothetical protein